MNKIIVVNDDGYRADGVDLLAKAFMPYGEVIMFAPSKEQSAKSQSITCWTPIKIREVKNRKYKCFKVYGTPADCVRMASGLYDDISLVVSGINNGFNIGIDTLYSGTVGAALDANLHGINAIAFSAPRGLVKDFAFKLDEVIKECLKISKHLKAKPYCLNVNFPKDPKNIAGYKLTRVGYIVDNFEMVEYGDGFKPNKYNLHYDPNDLEIDYTAQQNGYISISPLTVEKTNLKVLKRLKKLNLF